MTEPDHLAASLALQPMIHVEDMSASVAFYERLGGRRIQGSPDGDWALIEISGAQISLLAHPPNPAQNEGTVELNFEARDSLDLVAEQLQAAGMEITSPPTDTGFGRQLQITSPDGLLIKINHFGPGR